MEVGTLEDHVLRGLVGTTTLSTEHTGDAHGILGIADGEVTVGERVLLTVECLERGTLGHRLHHDLVTLHHIGIEGVQGLAIGHHDVVGDIHDVIDRPQTDGGQFVLQPVGRLLHLTVGNAHTGITLAGLCILNDHLDRQVVILHLELRTVGTVHRGLVAIALQPGVEVAGHTPVRETVGTVGSDIHLDEPVALQMIVFCSRRTYDSVLRQYDDALVGRTDADLILSTDHTIALHATQLGLLDDELLITIIKHTAEIGHNHLLTSRHVRGTTDNL